MSHSALRADPCVSMQSFELAGKNGTWFCCTNIKQVLPLSDSQAEEESSYKWWADSTWLERGGDDKTSLEFLGKSGEKSGRRGFMGS